MLFARNSFYIGVLFCVSALMGGCSTSEALTTESALNEVPTYPEHMTAIGYRNLFASLLFKSGHKKEDIVVSLMNRGRRELEQEVRLGKTEKEIKATTIAMFDSEIAPEIDTWSKVRMRQSGRFTSSIQADMRDLHNGIFSLNAIVDPTQKVSGEVLSGAIYLQIVDFVNQKWGFRPSKPQIGPYTSFFKVNLGYEPRVKMYVSSKLEFPVQVAFDKEKLQSIVAKALDDSKNITVSFDYVVDFKPVLGKHQGPMSTELVDWKYVAIDISNFEIKNK